MTISRASMKEIGDRLAEETDVGHRDDSDLGVGGMTTKALSVSGVG